MKKLVIFALSILVFTHVQSQINEEKEEKKKQIELGVFTSSIVDPLNGSGITFRIGSDKVLFRSDFRTLQINSTENENQGFISKNTTFNTGIGLGVEFRSKERKRFILRHGPQFNVEYTNRELTNEFSDLIINNSEIKTEFNEYRFGTGYLIGFNYLLTDKLQFGLEFSPSISYLISSSEIENSTDEINNETSRRTSSSLEVQNILFSLTYIWNR